MDPKIPILPVLQARKIPPPQPGRSVVQPSDNLYSTIEDDSVISENEHNEAIKIMSTELQNQSYG